MSDEARRDPPFGELLTTRQVCQALNCSRNTVARLVATRKLPKVKLGRAVRFRPEDIRQMLEGMSR